MFEDKVLQEEKNEFFWRMCSSFLFILIVVLLFWVPHMTFSVICWGTCAFMMREIFSNKVTKQMPLRLLMATFCCIGTGSFIYCREHLGQWGCVFLICVSSFTDIGAYSFGKILKGPKLCPRISPKKTWAGVVGGIFLGNVISYCLKSPFFQMERTFVVDFWTIQMIILASIGGDLLESWFKRKIRVKDMGNLFPGHGGILDRLDSLLLSSVVLAIMGVLY
jgi:phosphatidate cytidylyltransferase